MTISLSLLTSTRWGESTKKSHRWKAIPFLSVYQNLHPFKSYFFGGSPLELPRPLFCVFEEGGVIPKWFGFQKLQSQWLVKPSAPSPTPCSPAHTRLSEVAVSIWSPELGFRVWWLRPVQGQSGYHTPCCPKSVRWHSPKVHTLPRHTTAYSQLAPVCVPWVSYKPR